jgi:hypothetical protein
MNAETTITITDESTGNRDVHTFTLEFLETHLTAGEFLRRRIYEEVLEYNSKLLEPSSKYHGLVQPKALEQTLNG